MVFHHLFYNAQRYLTYSFTGLIVNQEITLSIAKEMKICVAIFAALSGYGIYKKTGKLEQEGKYRARGIISAFFRYYLKLVRDVSFLTLLIVLLSFAFRFEKRPETLWGDRWLLGTVSNMVCLPWVFKVKWASSPWWYLKISILFNLISPFMYMAVKKRGGAVLLASAVIIPVIGGYNVSHDNIWRYLPAFIGGMMTAEMRLIDKLRNAADRAVEKASLRKCVILFAAVLLYAVLLYFRALFGIKNQIIHAIQAILIIITVALVMSETGIPVRVLNVFGRNSKYMWLIHAFIYSQIMGSALYSYRNIWLIFFVVIAASLAASLAARKICALLWQGIMRLSDKTDNLRRSTSI